MPVIRSSSSSGPVSGSHGSTHSMGSPGLGNTLDMASPISEQFQNIDTELLNQLRKEYGFEGRENSVGFSNWLKWYDYYLGVIAQYKGTQYYDMLVNNPYVRYQQYQPTAGEQIGRVFGLQDQEVRYQQERQNAAMDYLSKILGNVQENNYNSTASQVARDQVAGFNDTLSGSIANDTAAANNETDTGRPDTSIGDDSALDVIGSAIDLGQFGVSFVQGCLGMFQSFQQLGMNRIAKDNAQVDLFRNLFDSVVKTEAGRISVPEDPDGNPDWSSVPEETLKAAIVRANSNPMFKGRLQKMYKQMVGTVYTGDNGRPSSALMRAYSKNVAETSGNVVQTARDMSLPGFSFTEYGEFAKQIGTYLTDYDLKLKEYGTKIKKLEHDILEANARAAKAQAKYQEDYFNGLNGGAAARSENRFQEFRYDSYEDQTEQFDINKISRRVQKLQLEFQEYLDGAKRDVMEFVRGGNRWFNQMGMLMLPGLLGAMDKAPSQIVGALSSLPGLLSNPAGTAVQAMSSSGPFQSSVSW